MQVARRSPLERLVAPWETAGWGGEGASRRAAGRERFARGRELRAPRGDIVERRRAARLRPTHEAAPSRECHTRAPEVRGAQVQR